MLFFGGGTLRDRAVGLGWIGRRRGGPGLEPADIAAGGQRETGAQQHRRSPKAAAHPFLVPSRTTSHFSYSSEFRELIPAEHFNLPHPEHFNSRPAPCLDPTANTNPSILEGLKGNAGRLETG